tara:strand:+ start:135 stop:641 length:507 start_codon:yes stop_codon:yes gene_type:complete
MLLKINIKNHLEAAFSVLLLIFGYFLLIVLFNFNFGVIIITLIAFLLFVAPGIYLHIEYWFNNKNDKYIINLDSIIEINKDNEKKYYSNEIEQIVLYGSATLFKPWFHLSAMEQYHFASVFLKNGNILIITCLLTPRVDKAMEKLKDVKIKKKKGLFNSIYFKNDIKS